MSEDPEVRTTPGGSKLLIWRTSKWVTIYLNRDAVADALFNPQLNKDDIARRADELDRQAETAQLLGEVASARCFAHGRRADITHGSSRNGWSLTALRTDERPALEALQALEAGDHAQCKSLIAKWINHQATAARILRTGSTADERLRSLAKDATGLGQEGSGVDANNHQGVQLSEAENPKPSADAHAVADSLVETAAALRALGNGDAATSMGAIEAFGKAYRETNEENRDRIAEAITDAGHDIRNGLIELAKAIRETKGGNGCSS